MKGLSLLAAAAVLAQPIASAPARIPPCLKSIMPKKDWNRRQARNKMAKASRKRNRA